MEDASEEVIAIINHGILDDKAVWEARKSLGEYDKTKGVASLCQCTEKERMGQLAGGGGDWELWWK
jgi:hypothetical protein